MREAFDKILGAFAREVKIHSKMEWCAKALFWTVLLWPGKGLVWEHRLHIEALMGAAKIADATLATSILLWGVSGLLIFFFVAKGLDLVLPKRATVEVPVAASQATQFSADGSKQTATPKETIATEIISPFDHKPQKLRFKRDEDPQVIVGDMIFTEKDLFTSVLVTGVTGTGKTSAAIFPMLEQIFNIYNEQGDGPLGNIGGLCLDVKGEFFEGIIYYMHQAGRNIFEDIQVIRPNCYMPIVRFRDPTTGYFFYLNAKSCSSGAEAWDLIRGKKFNDGSDIPLNVFTYGRRKLETFEARLKELTFPVGGRKMNFLGWRWLGERLVRVTHTPAFNQTHCLLKDGKKIAIDGPKSLVYDGVTFVDNNLRYNIVEPHKPAPEAAMRLNLISTLAEGEKQTGENAYWYKRARSHIGSCIELWRSAYDDTPQCTAQAIYKMTQQDDYCRKQVKLVEAKVKIMQDELAKMTDFSDRMGMERDIERLTSIIKYFTEEWGKYDSKTKTIVGSVVANAFDTFNKDPILQDSFCQPKTFSFEQCIQEGKIFVLVAGDEYETVAKILGTALKMDFQSVVLSRLHRSELNQKRKIMMVNDECQKFVVAGGSQGAGDEHFMSLCRQSKCFNINATQADSWIISVVGKENSDVYLQNYNGRIWFRTNDKETADKAEILCGIKKQKTRSAGGEKTIHIENLLLGPKGSADHTPSFTEKEEEKPRFAKDKFYNLEMWECVLFNGTRTGGDKACQSQCEPAIVTGDEGKPEVAKTMRLYFQGYIENVAFKQNGGKVFDHIHAAAAATVDAVTTLMDAAPLVAPTAPITTPATPTAAAPVASHTSATPSTAITQVPIPVAGQTKPTVAPTPAPISAAPSMPNQALTPSAILGPVPELKSLGEPDALKARAAKLLKSVSIIAPRVSDPMQGTVPPFTAPTAETPATPPAPVTVAEVAAQAAAIPLPVVGKNFSANDVTPRQLQGTMASYKAHADDTVTSALKSANFIPPVNPSEYLSQKREEELLKAGDPDIAAERAALGPQGKQGGSPKLALEQGGAITIPAVAKDIFEKARASAVAEEAQQSHKAFITAVSQQDGPTPDADTLELLKNLKPEANDDTQK